MAKHTEQRADFSRAPANAALDFWGMIAESFLEGAKQYWLCHHAQALIVQEAVQRRDGDETSAAKRPGGGSA